MSENKEFALSASKISSYLKCSWIYYMENVIRMADGGNDGSRRGSISHNIFERWIQPEYRIRVENILKHGSIYCDEELIQEIKDEIEEIGLGEEDNKGQNNFEMICDMIYVGFSYDFYCDGWEIDYDNLEKKFELRSKNPPYVIRGLIDKPAKKDGMYRISDYKTSAQKRTESELEFEIQALSYTLFAKKELLMDAFVEFIFLRYPKDPINRVENITEDQLKGFEEYLSSLYLYLKDFDEEKAKSNMAADLGFPKGGGFKGLVVCGRATHEGQLKKDGTLMWHCPYKFGFKYYSRRDRLGNIIESSKDEEVLLDRVKEGEYIAEHTYLGCPKFNS